MSNNDDNKKTTREKVVEDGPTMRSMMLAPPRGVPLMPSASGFGGPMLREMPSKQPIAVKSLPQRKTWVLPAGPLPSVPSGYPLERTHTKVCGASPTQVAQRIADCLRAESIAASFEKDDALVRAETHCGLRLSVRLWSENNQVVAEVQRSSGCSFVFHQTAKMVLRAASNITTEGIETACPPPMPSRSSLSIPQSVPKSSPEEWNACSLESLEIAGDLLQEERLDCHQMALESLVQLTGAPNCGSYCAKEVLNGKVFATILALIECSRMDREGSPEDLTEFEIDHFAVLKRHALTVLANCLSSLDRTSELTSTVQRCKALTSACLLDALVSVVSVGAEKPHEALQACKSLQLLSQVEASVKQQICAINAPLHLEQARCACRHALLEDISHQLYQEL